MFIKSFVAALSALALIVVPMAGAWASNQPIPGIDIVVRKKPGGSALPVKSDAKGQFVLKDLAPGTYTLQIDGPSLKRALGPSRTTAPTVAVLIGLLLPAVQSSREASASTPAPQAYRGQPGERGIEMTFTVPEQAGKSSTWKGTVEQVK